MCFICYFLFRSKSKMLTLIIAVLLHKDVLYVHILVSQCELVLSLWYLFVYTEHWNVKNRSVIDVGAQRRSSFGFNRTHLSPQTLDCCSKRGLHILASSKLNYLMCSVSDAYCISIKPQERQNDVFGIRWLYVKLLTNVQDHQWSTVSVVFRQHNLFKKRLWFTSI